MCGIGGFRKFGDTPIELDEIHGLGTQLERRGNHATGIALMRGKDIHVFKMPKPAWGFFLSDEYEEFMKAHFSERTETVLIHTRAATVGNPLVNENNHPLTAGKATIIHNGGIHNHMHLFTKNNWKRNVETDSDIIRAIVDSKGITAAAIKQLNEMNGGAAIAAIHPDYPGKLLLGRSGNPLTLGWNPKTNIMSWSSQKDMLYVATKVVTPGLNLFWQPNRTDVLFFPMPDNSAYIFGENGQEFHAEMKTSNYTTNPNYRVNDTYWDSLRRWKEEHSRDKKEAKLLAAVNGGQVATTEEEPAAYECRNKNCRAVIEIPEALKNDNVWDLHCKACGYWLADPPSGQTRKHANERASG